MNIREVLVTYQANIKSWYVNNINSKNNNEAISLDDIWPLNKSHD